MGRLRDWIKEEGAIKDLWNSRKVGVPLWIALGLLTLYWFYWVPPPGYAIGALGVVAGVMSVREIKTPGKIIWVFLLVCLLVTEFRAIDKDRADNEKRQSEFFAAQKDGFNTIATQATSNLKETTAGLAAAINGLNSNLQVANQTLIQTQPHAEFVSGNFSIPNAPVPPAMFETGTDYEFDFHYINGGNSQGNFLKALGEVYVGKPDDMDTQLEIEKQFEKSWMAFEKAFEERKTLSKPMIVLPQAQEYWTEDRTFSSVEIARLVHQGNTVYGVSRIEYSDPTGKWYSDQCNDFQVTEKGFWIQVLHSCFVFVNGRHPAKR